jgi:hypothetical protein
VGLAAVERPRPSSGLRTTSLMRKDESAQEYRPGEIAPRLAGDAINT